MAPKSNIDMLFKLSDLDSPVVGVYEHRFEGQTDFLTRIDLDFDGTVANFVANGDYDTLDITIDSALTDQETVRVNVTTASPWSRIVGQRFFWLWELTNSQGYVDGVRIEFGRPGESTTIFEMVVIASMIQTYEVATF